MDKVKQGYEREQDKIRTVSQVEKGTYGEGIVKM